jgi:hypothetical protein
MAMPPQNPPTGGGKIGREKPHWTHYGIFWATLLAFFGVCAYTYYARQQVLKSETANDIAHQAFTQANRPYVLINNYIPARIGDLKGQLHSHVGVQFFNYGSTPAYSLRPTFCDPIIRHDTNQPNFECHLSDAENKSEYVVGPKQPLNPIGPQVEDSDLLATRDESTAIYIFGRVDYLDGVDLDINGQPKRRVTWFCSRVISSQLRSTAPPYTPVQAPLEGTPLVAVGCNALNCADESCQFQKLPIMNR